jgi:5-methylcytosine-specific restriction endonuclease McrA
MSTSWEYDAYLASAAWQRVRVAALVRARWRCERCGRLADDVHHRTYRRLGHERPEDVEVLCADCHALADAERRRGEATFRGEPVRPSTEGG